MSEEKNHNQPRLGVFITMMAGLLLFFGFVSRVGKINDFGDLLSANRQNVDSKAQLSEARDRALAVLGGKEATARNTAPPMPNFKELDGQLDDIFKDSAPQNRIPQPAQPQRVPQPAPRDFTQPSPAPQHNPIPPAKQERSYTVKDGDTLWKIAQEFYGDGNMYYLIQKANGNVTPSGLSVGRKLVIPESRVASRQ
jgi:nucleoid-associated protein YgaU